MSIIDDNARFEDEDKAMQAILNDEQTVDVDAITEPPEAILAYNDLEDAYHREIQRANMLQDLLDAHQSQQEDADGTQPSDEVQDTLAAIMDAQNGSEALRALKHGARTPETVSAVMCAMQAQVASEVYSFQHAADCVCRPSDNYQNSGHALRFMLDAINEKMERDLGPKTLTHRTQVPRVGTMTMELRRTGPNQYAVDDVEITAAEPF